MGKNDKRPTNLGKDGEKSDKRRQMRWKKSGKRGMKIEKVWQTWAYMRKHEIIVGKYKRKSSNHATSKDKYVVKAINVDKHDGKIGVNEG